MSALDLLIQKLDSTISEQRKELERSYRELMGMLCLRWFAYDFIAGFGFQPVLARVETFECIKMKSGIQLSGINYISRPVYFDFFEVPEKNKLHVEVYTTQPRHTHSFVIESKLNTAERETAFISGICDFVLTHPEFNLT